MSSNTVIGFMKMVIRRYNGVRIYSNMLKCLFIIILQLREIIMSIYCEWMKKVSLVKTRAKQEKTLSEMTLEEMKEYVQHIRLRTGHYLGPR